MFKFTLSLHDKNKMDEEIIKKNIFAKNPIIFVVTSETHESIYQIVNMSENYRKNILVLDKFDLARSFAYLHSFIDLNRRNILLVAPSNLKRSAVTYANDLIASLKKNCKGLQ